MCRCRNITLSAQLTFHPETHVLAWVLLAEEPSGFAWVSQEGHADPVHGLAELKLELARLAESELPWLMAESVGPFD
jgi:hypothetical protein